MRSRRARLEEMRDEGARGAALALRQLDDDQRVHLGLPDRHHDDLDRHRRPRRARDRRTCSSRALGNVVGPRRGGRDRVAIAYLVITAIHIDRRRDGAEVLRDRARRDRRAPRRAAAAAVSGSLFHPFIVVAERRLDCGSCGCSASIRRGARRRAAAPRSSSALIAESMTGGQLDPGEAGMLDRRLPPARAGGAPGDDADPGGRHASTSPRTSRRRCAAASPAATRGWSSPRTTTATACKGIVHVNALAQLLMAEGPDAVDRAARARRADRARDQAARRPARRPPAPAHVDGGRRRRVRPHRRHRDRRGHHRGGRRRDRRRDRPGRRRGPPAGQRRLVRARPRRGHRPRRTTASTCRSTPTPTTRSAASCSASSAGCRKRGDTVDAERLLDPRRVGAREPHRGGAHPRAPRRQCQRRRERSGSGEAAPPTGASKRPSLVLTAPRRGVADGSGAPATEARDPARSDLATTPAAQRASRPQCFWEGGAAVSVRRTGQYAAATSSGRKQLA